MILLKGEKMIISKEMLVSLKKKVVMVDGCFDPLHLGHLKYFEEAAKFGLPVLCNMRADDYFVSKKKRTVMLPQQQRAKLIDSLKNISYVYINTTSTHDVLDLLQPAKYIKGKDWETTGLPKEEMEICRKHEIEIVYLDTAIDSSTNITKRFIDDNLKIYYSNRVSEFENYVLNQKAFGSEHYDKSYFQDEWRNATNSYSIEKRRELEAKNPQNIKDVFNPDTALDIGCGPGALMLFLHELGIETYGIDFSSAARDIAPPEIRSKIHVGSIVDFVDLGQEFDLVICREVLEHLTVLQVAKVVDTLARYTSKFLYITTRFHPDSGDFLGIATQEEVDPTHITLLHKEFLRTLFILKGLKSRPDLEKKLDWKNYGRVLVFERIGTENV